MSKNANSELRTGASGHEEVPESKNEAQAPSEEQLAASASMYQSCINQPGPQSELEADQATLDVTGEDSLFASTVEIRPIHEHPAPYGVDITEFAKVVVIGAANVGKSSLVNRLCGEFFNPHQPMTDGVIVKDCFITKGADRVMLSLWDFGGQLFYLNSHQSFWNEECLYLLAWDPRIGIETAILPYLESVSSRVPTARIVLVATKADTSSPL